MRYGANTVIVVSYADFITLLFAFFVVLLFVFPGGQAQDLQHQVPLSNSEPMPFANVQAVENVERSGDMERFVAPTKGNHVLRPRIAGRQLSGAPEGDALAVVQRR